jgi:hypothetical protein
VKAECNSRGFHLPIINPLVRTVIGRSSRRVTILSIWGITMAVLLLDHAVRLTELGKTTITRAIKSSWLSARRKEDGSYEIDPVEREPSARRLQALIPWRAARLANERADEELRRRIVLAEERLVDLKAALDDMRAQRDAWQAMAQARIRPAPASATSRFGRGCALQGDVEVSGRAGSAVAP